MRDPSVPPARFTIADAAKQEIENIRAFWNADKQDDPADVVWVSWAQWRPRAGEPYWGVFVSFYGRSSRKKASSSIQVVSGLPVLFTPGPGQASKFDGKMVD